MGSFVLAVGLWLRFDPETVSLLNGDKAPDTFFIGEYDSTPELIPTDSVGLQQYAVTLSTRLSLSKESWFYKRKKIVEVLLLLQVFFFFLSVCLFFAFLCIFPILAFYVA